MKTKFNIGDKVYFQKNHSLYDIKSYVFGKIIAIKLNIEGEMMGHLEYTIQTKQNDPCYEGIYSSYSNRIFLDIKEYITKKHEINKHKIEEDFNKVMNEIDEFKS